jgi:hypothetical protein
MSVESLWQFMTDKPAAQQNGEAEMQNRDPQQQSQQATEMTGCALCFWMAMVLHVIGRSAG